MLSRTLHAGLRRGAVQSTALTVLMSLVVALVIMSAVLGMRAGSAINSLWKEAVPPNVVHMYVGTPDAKGVVRWVDGRSDVKSYRLMRSLSVPVRQLTIVSRSQADSVLEPVFVTTPERFDLLIDQNGKLVRPGPGEIALPVHYKAEGVAKVGNVVHVQGGSRSHRLKVVDFVRDPQMNPSMVTSKRLAVHPSGFAEFDKHLEPECLTESRLVSGTPASPFISDFETSGLSSRGITIDTSTPKLMNGVTTVPTVAVTLLAAVLLVVVASFTLRYTFFAAMEDDLPQISVLKAAGTPPRGIKCLYLVKYFVLMALGMAVGCFLSLPLVAPLDKAVLLYLGEPVVGARDIAAPLAVAIALGLVMVGSCCLILHRIDKLSAVQVLRAGASGKIRPECHCLELTSSRRVPVRLWMGVREAFRLTYALLFGMSSACTIVVILLVCVVTTMGNPGLATCLGIGGADVRMDAKEIGSSRGGADGLDEAFVWVRADLGVSHVVKMTVHRYDITSAGGKKTVVLVESGDHTVFQMNYMRGKAPAVLNEIALSVNQVREAKADVGNAATLTAPRERAGDGSSSPVAGQNLDSRKLRVTGVYQDIINDGETVKTPTETVAGDTNEPVQRVIYADLKENADPTEVVAGLRVKPPGIAVVQIQDYIS